MSSPSCMHVQVNSVEVDAADVEQQQQRQRWPEESQQPQMAAQTDEQPSASQLIEEMASQESDQDEVVYAHAEGATYLSSSAPPESPPSPPPSLPTDADADASGGHDDTTTRRDEHSQAGGRSPPRHSTLPMPLPDDEESEDEDCQILPHASVKSSVSRSAAADPRSTTAICIAAAVDVNDDVSLSLPLSQLPCMPPASVPRSASLAEEVPPAAAAAALASDSPMYYDSIPMSICEVSQSQQQLLPSQLHYSSLPASAHSQIDAAQPSPLDPWDCTHPPEQPSLDAHDLESSDDDVALPAHPPPEHQPPPASFEHQVSFEADVDADADAHRDTHQQTDEAEVEAEVVAAVEHDGRQHDALAVPDSSQLARVSSMSPLAVSPVASSPPPPPPSDRPAASSPVGSSGTSIRRCLYPPPQRAVPLPATSSVAPTSPPHPSPVASPVSPPPPAHSPSSLRRSPRSILSTSAEKTRSPRPRASPRSVRFDLPAGASTTEEEDASRPSPTRRKKGKLSPFAARIIARAAELERIEEAAAAAAAVAVVAPATGPVPAVPQVIHWSAELLSMNLSACSPPDSATHATHRTATGASAAASSPRGALAPTPAQVPLSPISPLKLPVLPLSDSDSPDESTTQPTPTSARLTAPLTTAAAPVSTAAQVSLPLPLPSQLYDEGASQVFDDPYFEPYMLDAKLEGPKPEPTFGAAAAASSSSCAVSFDGSSHLTPPSSAASVIFSGSPPKFVAPHTIKVESPIVAPTIVKRESSTASTKSERVTIKQEHATHVKKQRSPAHSPMRAPPPLLSQSMDISPPATMVSLPATPATSGAMSSSSSRRTATSATTARPTPGPSSCTATSRPLKRPLSPDPSESPIAPSLELLEDSAANSFAPPAVLTMAMERHIKRETGHKAAKAPRSATAPASTDDVTVPAAAQPSSSPTRKYKRPRLHKQGVPDRSRDVKRVIDGVVKIELGSGGIDNRIVAVQDGQVMEDIEEVEEEEEPVQTASVTDMKSKSTKDAKTKRQKRGDATVKKQKATADTKSESATGTGSGAASSPPPSRTKKSKPVDSKQTSLNGFFFPKQTPPAAPSNAVMLAPIPAPSPPPSLPSFTPSKRTYATDSSSAPRPSKRHAVGDGDGDVVEAKVAPLPPPRFDTIDLLDTDEEEEAPAALPRGRPVSRHTIMRSASDPEAHLRLQRQLGALVSVVRPPQIFPRPAPIVGNKKARKTQTAAAKATQSGESRTRAQENDPEPEFEESQVY